MENETQMYFATNPDAKHDEHLINYQLDELSLQFYTDAGVFSKTRVDYGSCVLLKVLKQLEISGNILDVGTGYGPLGLFAAKLWPKSRVTMIDVNERALALAKRNAQLNEIDNVNIFSSDCYRNLDDQEQFGLILTNPPIRAGKQVVDDILQNAKKHLQVGGIVLVVIQKKQGASSAKKCLEQTYGNCEILQRDKGYYILKSVKK